MAAVSNTLMSLAFSQKGNERTEWSDLHALLGSNQCSNLNVNVSLAQQQQQQLWQRRAPYVPEWQWTRHLWEVRRHWFEKAVSITWDGHQCLLNRAKTTPSERTNSDANQGKFIQITAVSINFSEWIFKMRIKKTPTDWCWNWNEIQREMKGKINWSSSYEYLKCQCRVLQVWVVLHGVEFVCAKKRVTLRCETLRETETEQKSWVKRKKWKYLHWYPH